MSRYWAANLAALSARAEPLSRQLAERLAEAGPGPDWGLRNRAGHPLPALMVQGRPRSLISAYDADKEAQRWAADVPGGTIAVWGAGGTAAAAALSARNVALAFWVEPRIEAWQALFTWEDWTPWIAQDTWVPIWTEGLQWGKSLRSRYHPLWDGGFQTLEWRGAVQGVEGLWEAHRIETGRSLAAIAGDASTQARFGERWYRNTLANLKRLRPGRFEGCPGVRVVIAGAGPGLDDALASPENLRWLEDRSRSGDRLFATDTALPALTAAGVLPDLVLCLDGQLATYHHFVTPPPPVPLVADLASIPLLGRLGMPVIRYLSGHPFGTVIRREFPELPSLDGSLGNVSGLGLTTALSLGARTVDAWGVGFSYRDGQAYAHGTYVYETAGKRAGRTAPLETLLSSACYGASGLERRWEAGRALDSTPLLRDYKTRWHEAPQTCPPVALAHGGADGRWDSFVASWRRRLETLPIPPVGRAVHSFVLNLPADVRSDWWALWPLALALHRQGVGPENLPRSVIERALSFLED